MKEVQIKKDTTLLVTQTLRKLSVSKPSDITPRVAFTEGLNIRGAYQAAPLQTMAAVSAMLRATCEAVDANKTIQGAEQLAEAAQYLIKQYPAMTVEEWAVVCYRIRCGYYERYGAQYKMYERLKVADFARYAAKHEEERIPLLEELHRPPPSRGITSEAVTRMYDSFKTAQRESTGQKLKAKLEAEQKQAEQTRAYAKIIVEEHELKQK